MSTAEVTQMVFEAITNQKSKDRQLFIKQHQTMSRINPDGVIRYCDKEIYKLIDHLKESSTLGHFWVINGAGEIESDEGHRFLTKFAEVELKLKDRPNRVYPKDHPKGDINEFLNVIFQLKEIQNIKYDFIDNERSIRSEERHEKRILKAVKIGTELNKPKVALICFYNGKPITLQNFESIANEFGIPSSKRLYDDYTFFVHNSNRLAIHDTRTKNRNKIKLFECVINHLSGIAKNKAENELNTIKSKINNAL